MSFRTWRQISKRNEQTMQGTKAAQPEDYAHVELTQVIQVETS
jgi:hypothetical protein